ncbi:MAG: SDR family oxidoreductase [Flavobacteriales bacterium]|nr:SDR family oxidoreductase [Flavobacteriales bacterium]MCX7768873.1 SDR family oxidoreductase [Flavobacteriales bacterium]MDW8410314.1 SDR family oxidoreductase [Flavobacteriales bacterium]
MLIALTGATGFAGIHILHELVKRGYQVKALFRSQGAYNEAARIWRRCYGDSWDQAPVEWIRGDGAQWEALCKLISGSDVLVHAAGLVSYHARDRHRLYQHNVLFTRNLVDLSLGSKTLKKLVFVSSTAAISRAETDHPITEATPWKVSPNNVPYGQTKMLAEMEVWRAYAEGLPIAILNPGIILGYGPAGSSGHSLVRHVYYSPRFYPVGSNGFVDVRDVARCVAESIEKNIEGERFILISENLTFQELFKRIALRLQKSPPSVPLTPRLRRFLSLAGEALALLGFRPAISAGILHTFSLPLRYDPSKALKTFSGPFISVEDTLAWSIPMFMEDFKNEN